MAAQVGERQFSVGKTILFSCFLTVAGLSVIELAARFTRPEMRALPRFLVRSIDVDIELPFMQLDPELFWRPAPGFSGPLWNGQVTIDALGQRQASPAQTLSSRRLLCFGDSITFGFGVDDADSYPAQLAALLGPSGIEVHNAGVTGYTSYQTLRWLRQQLKNQHVDEVTLLVGWNDGTQRPITDAEFGARLKASTSTADQILGNLAIYRLMKVTWLRRGLETESRAQKRTTARVPLDDYVRNLEMFVTEARTAGARPHLISLPHRLFPGEQPKPGPYLNALTGVAKRLSVPLYDVGILSDSHPGVSRRGNASLFIDSLHLSTEGNRVMASLIARQLQGSDTRSPS